MSEWSDIIDGIGANVSLLRELGEKSVEVDPSTMAGFAAKVSSPTKIVSAPAPAARTPPPPQQSVLPPSDPLPVNPVVENIDDRPGALASLAAQIEACSACGLRTNRTRSVPGQGNPHSPDVMFIGEAPGAEEDRQGIAFVGKAGQFLTKMINAMGYSRDDVFIANICKCRPPGNRTPMPQEMRVCFPFLRTQIAVIRPKIIVVLGNTAAKALLDTQIGIMRLQGQWTTYNGIPVMPTYHPSYVIRFDSVANQKSLHDIKKQVWSALKLVLTRLGKTPPPINKPPQEG